MIKKLFFVLVVAGLLFAEPTYNPSGVDYSDTSVFNHTYLEGRGVVGGRDYAPWIFYALLSVMLVLIIGAIVYVIGKSFGIPKATAWAQSELVNMVGTFLLLMAVIFILEIITTQLLTQILSGSAWCGGEEFYGDNPLDFAMCKVQGQITTLDKLWNQAYQFNKPLEQKAKRCYTFFGVTIQCGDWFGPTRRHIESSHLIGEKAMGLLVPLHAQFALLRYVAQNMLAIFLPLGILLRAFPLTRGVGGLIISIVFGLYFVYPVLNFIIDPSFVQEVDEIEVPEQLKEFDGCWDGYTNTVVLISKTSDENVEKEIDFSFARAADIVAEISITGLFYPIVAFAGAVMFIHIATPFFSGEVADFARVVQKMV
ncbi:hypothetical protein KO465_05920 [Candidatus Micrarchaeota archaeon]|nr:hypothetical protein [Candidatus Micrarchaeota archaeon]